MKLLYNHLTSFKIFIYFFQEMKLILFLVIFAVAQSEENNGSCKDVLQGYLTGQLSSALGAYQVEALRREFKSFTDVMEKSMKKFKENVETKLRNIKGKITKADQHKI